MKKINISNTEDLNKYCSRAYTNIILCGTKGIILNRKYFNESLCLEKHPDAGKCSFLLSNIDSCNGTPIKEKYKKGYDYSWSLWGSSDFRRLENISIILDKINKNIVIL
jgi:hypothetical protein